MPRALGERRGQSARRNYRGSRHDDASPHKWGCTCLGRRKRLRHSPLDKTRNAGSGPHNYGAQLLMMRVGCGSRVGETRARATQGARDRIPQGVLAARSCTARRDGRQTRQRLHANEIEDPAFARGMRRIGWRRCSGPTSPCPMFSSRWRLASGARTSSALRIGVQDLAASKGSQWSPHGARVYFLAGRPTPKPDSPKHI